MALPAIGDSVFGIIGVGLNSTLVHRLRDTLSAFGWIALVYQGDTRASIPGYSLSIRREVERDLISSRALIVVLPLLDQEWTSDDWILPWIPQLTPETLILIYFAVVDVLPPHVSRISISKVPSAGYAEFEILPPGDHETALVSAVTARFKKHLH